MSNSTKYRELIEKQAAFKKNNKQDKSEKVMDANYYKIYDEDKKNVYEHFGTNRPAAEKASKAKAHYKETKDGFKSSVKRTKMNEGLIPGDYSRVKTIDVDPSEYRTVNSRDMKFFEKVTDNAKRAGKNAKQVANNVKALPKNKKILLGMAGTAIGATTVGLANEAIQLTRNPERKKDTRADKSRDKDKHDRIFRDGVNPQMKRMVTMAPTKLMVDGAMLAPSIIIGTKGAELGSKVGHKLTKGSPVATNVGRIAGGIGASYAASIPTRTHDAALMSYQEIREMDRLKKRYLGKGITKKEKSEIRKDNRKEYFGLVPNHKITKGTIEERVQAKRRNQDFNKKASNSLDEMYKEAREKWTSQDRKGYAKNVAIGVAQDFLNAGNPLNIGSSIVGSVADAAILERSSLNMNKKFKKQQVSEKNLKKYNTAVDVKNGMALPHAVMK